jgi:hypothetical protein
MTQLCLLYDLAGRVPPLLQAFDSRSDKHDPALLDDLSILQQQLDSWLTSGFTMEQQNRNLPLDAERVSPEHSIQPDGTSGSLWYLTRECLCRICHLLLAECVDALLSHKSTVKYPVCVAETRAVQLRRNIQSLARAAEIPVCVARAVNAPLHFLVRYYAQAGDTAGLEWCAQLKENILESIPWLRWDVLLPWGLLTVHDTPMFRG